MTMTEGQTTVPALELSRSWRKSFRSTKIIRGVDLAIRQQAKRHAVIGPNWRRKITLFHLISGITQPSAGRIHSARQDNHRPTA